MGSNVNRNDLEEFQRNLLRKINSRLLHDRDMDIIPENDQLEMLNGINSRGLEDIDAISTASLSNDN